MCRPTGSSVSSPNFGNNLAFASRLCQLRTLGTPEQACTVQWAGGYCESTWRIVFYKDSSVLHSYHLN